MLERYFIPIAPYLFTTAGVAVCIYLFCSLKQEIQRTRIRIQEREAQLDRAAQRLENQIAEMRAELRDAEERTAQLVPPAPAKSGLNVNMRTQVLRMSRLGEAEENIAVKLGLPRDEVALVLKVHKLFVESPPLTTVQ